MSGTRSGFSQPTIGDGPAGGRVGLLAERDFLEVRFGGTAAQGVILMGVVLATAATLDHRFVAQTQTHGLEESDAQGHSDVIVSDDPVDYPELLGVDLLVAFCQGSADSYAPMLRTGGVFVYDLDRVVDPPSFPGESYGMPFGRLAEEAAGDDEPSPDLVALGAAIAITGVVSAGSLRKTLDELVLPGSREAKLKALAYGMALDTGQWRRTTAWS